VAGWAIEQWTANSLCLGVNSSNQAGIWACTSHPDQTWHWGQAGDGGNQLVNGNGQCLGVAGGSTTEGAHVVGWTCLGTGHPDQYWLEYFPFCAGGICLWYLINVHSGQVLGTQGGIERGGTNAVIWDYQGELNNQVWNIDPAQPGVCTV
jgi:hypothetical protein